MDTTDNQMCLFSGTYQLVLTKIDKPKITFIYAQLKHSFGRLSAVGRMSKKKRKEDYNITTLQQSHFEVSFKRLYRSAALVFGSF